jgi:hypothetical protein
MEPKYKLRLYLLTAVILAGFGTLLSELHEFQIKRQNEFQALVPGNRTVSQESAVKSPTVTAFPLLATCATTSQH